MAELTKNMSREIKFRAWDENNGFMFYHDEDGEFDRKIDGERVGSDFDIKDLLFSPYDGILCMQFTGLKDKNGIEIYEGDIVRLKGGRKPKNGERPYYNTVVFFERGMFKIKENRTIFTDSSVLGLGLCEVIGSIHENTELLND